LEGRGINEAAVAVEVSRVCHYAQATDGGQRGG
jgi:hypothetical protein